MSAVAVDSGILYALFDASDKHHKAAQEFLLTNADAFVTTVPVLTEVVYLLQFDGLAQRAFLAFAAAVLDVDQQIIADVPRIIDVMAKYADLPADFADASLVALCERRGLDRIATVDSDFEIYRTVRGKHLENVFKSGNARR